MDIDTKLARSMCVLMTVNKYKNDVSKLHDFIKLNRSYFPDVTDEFLDNLKKGSVNSSDENKENKENVPVFVELNYEKKTRK